MEESIRSDVYEAPLGPLGLAPHPWGFGALPTHAPPAITKARKVYLIGSMRNPKVPELATALRKEGFEVFDDWYSPGPKTDDHWQEYEQQRGRSYKEALDGFHAWNVFEFDKRHLDATDAVVLVMPAGKSAHMELGYTKGLKKKTYVLFDKEPERWDVMYRFVDKVCFGRDELIEALHASV